MQVTQLEACDFLKKHPNLLICPTMHPDYIVADASRNRSLTPVFFVYENNVDAYVHFFHLIQMQQRDGFEISNAYGYGGPVATTIKSDFLAEATKAYIAWCIGNAVIKETIKFHPLLANERFYHGEVEFKKNTVFVNLSSPNLLESYSVRARTAIRKAIKNSVVIEFVSKEKFLKIFPSIYLQLMHEIKAKEFYFFNEEYFKKISCIKNAQFVVATHFGEPIAAAIFLVQDAILEYHLSASNALGKNLSASNLIMHEALLKAKALGCLSAHLGGGTSNSSDDCLLFFKQGFAGELVKFKIGQCFYG